MLRQLSIFSLFVFFNLSFSQQLQLSPQAEISVLTIDQGDNLNDAFGHNAFRIKDRTLGLDVVYDYGRYDFDTPNFYLKFAQGKLNYLIGKRNFSDFFQVYRYYDRTIDEQKLNLSTTQKQKLHNYLINNHKPENRRYLYDFFYDNCATKIRDVLNTATNGSINYSELQGNENKTFRDLIHEHVGHNTWGSFGIDIALGSLTDRVANKEEQMFLPRYIYKHFEAAKINSNPLVKSTITIYKSKQDIGYKASTLFNPLVIMLILAFIIIFITYKDYKKLNRSKWLDIVLFAITGIAGMVLLFLWFGTDHTVTGYNYNLLWAFPINLFVIGQLLSKQIKNWFRGYLKFLLVMLCLMSLHWTIGVQVFALAFLPILVALIIRYVYLLKYYKTA
ncbi:lipoprotein N-acyltransferase Lnb domain-containing protein [Winogradskyella jejuensis]|uniref:Uncharacterized protein n=1 Tax=Winogradskyella jejuensis TaxID=1089305 RepID=A0A1M5SLX6_9FLAO|nr:DUF4105 domain-containing protein [Winogradskyella jejuensis]SHH39516.1 protein of unknown function [Winogradskyella jejuensis]